ncbi:MAG: carbohydrate ABC transporter substrate-binding protein, partial [Mesorhizobium sp.]
MRKSVASVLAGIGMALACSTSVHAQDKQLTIFWAEWDPANYLQELGNEYEKET